MPELVPAAEMPDATANSLTVLSYNVLLPNSSDGWWIYKYYSPSDGRDVTGWPHRQALLRRQLLGARADVVCVQEVSAESFEDDFAFMRAAGYEHALLAKGRMRNATFWRTARLSLRTSFSKDRTLTCHLALRGEEECEGEGGLELFIVNCHLSAGPQAPRRLKQVHEAADAIRKLLNKNAKEAAKLVGGKGGKGSKGGGATAAAIDIAAVPVVVCGDFNSQGATGVRELLTRGAVDPAFRESGDETEREQVDGGGVSDTPLTTKRKTIELGRFADAYALAYQTGPPPPTLVGQSLMPVMLAGDSGEASAAMREAVAKVFGAFSSIRNDGTGDDGDDGCEVRLMTRSDVDRWLLAINFELGRGSEMRSAEKLLLAHAEVGEPECLTSADLLAIYQEELDQGKFWAIEHDLTRLNGAGLARPGDAPWEARFDYIYFTAGTLRCDAVMESLAEDDRARLYSAGERAILPNSWHPSDHLPLAARFSLLLPAPGDTAAPSPPPPPAAVGAALGGCGI